MDSSPYTGIVKYISSSSWPPKYVCSWRTLKKGGGVAPGPRGSRQLPGEYLSSSFQVGLAYSYGLKPSSRFWTACCVWGGSDVHTTVNRRRGLAPKNSAAPLAWLAGWYPKGEIRGKEKESCVVLPASTLEMQRDGKVEWADTPASRRRGKSSLNGSGGLVENTGQPTRIEVPR